MDYKERNEESENLNLNNALNQEDLGSIEEEKSVKEEPEAEKNQNRDEKKDDPSKRGRRPLSFDELFF